MNYQLATVQTITADWLVNNNISLDVLRLDKLHPVVSGNKWFKLQYYLKEAKNLNCRVITFGGAWSNHIVATAYCCHVLGIPCTGIIRGEKPKILSATLKDAETYGMKLNFVSRESYTLLKNEHRLHLPVQEYNHQNLNNDNNYYIPEGGYGHLGAAGASDIGKLYDLSSYTHIIAGVGSGTMLAGLVMSAKPTQRIIGISSLKSNNNLVKEINNLLYPANNSLPHFEIIHDYHFGGFAKHSPALTSYMNEVFNLYHLPLDIVYTSKTFFGIQNMIENKFFPKNSRLIMIHSGGLQGNASMGDKIIF